MSRMFNSGVPILCRTDVDGVETIQQVKVITWESIMSMEQNYMSNGHSHDGENSRAETEDGLPPNY